MAITNGKSRCTCNIGHKTQIKHKQNRKHNTESFKMSNTEPNKNNRHVTHIVKSRTSHMNHKIKKRYNNTNESNTLDLRTILLLIKQLKCILNISVKRHVCSLHVSLKFRSSFICQPWFSFP